jgi:hypothetical protein
MRTRSLSLLVSGLLLAACGTSSPPPPPPPPAAATGLDYVDPAGSGWRLVKDGTSTGTRLVLNLVGPSGLMTRGVGFNLQAPAAVRFGVFPNRLPVNDTGVYQLLGGANDPNEPVALIGGIKPGNLLTVGVFQKGREKPAQDSGRALCQIALEFDAAAGPRAGDPIALAIPKAKVIREDIGSETDQPGTLAPKVRLADIAIALGTITAK